jgi:hypothetical protein
MARVLANAGVDAALRERVSELLSRCDRARYSGAGAGGPTELSTEASAIIDALEAAGIAPRGDRWHPTTINRMLTRAAA